MLQELLPPLVWLLELALLLLTLAGAWRTFERAGERGWAVLIPIYNAVALARAARCRSLTLLLLVPCVNLVVLVPVSIALARRFGKGALFGVGLAYLPFVFYPLLGLRHGEEVAPDTATLHARQRAERVAEREALRATSPPTAAPGPPVAVAPARSEAEPVVDPSSALPSEAVSPAAPGAGPDAPIIVVESQIGRRPPPPSGTEAAS